MQQFGNFESARAYLGRRGNTIMAVFVFGPRHVLAHAQRPSLARAYPGRDKNKVNGYALGTTNGKTVVRFGNFEGARAYLGRRRHIYSCVIKLLSRSES